MKVLYFILTLNNFEFNDINYLQKKGCVMGTICSPAFVNIFMGNLKNCTFTPTLEIFQHFTVDL